MTNLKSAFLDRLGVKNVNTFEHGPKGKQYGRAMILAVAATIGMSSQVAFADEDPSSKIDLNKTSSFEMANEDATSKIVASEPYVLVIEGEEPKSRMAAIEAVALDTLGMSENNSKAMNITMAGLEVTAFALAPQEAALRMGTKLVAGTGASILTGDKSSSIHMAGAVATVVMATTVNPVLGAYIVYNQVNKTHEFFEDKKEARQEKVTKATNDRIESLRRGFQHEYIIEERTKIANMPEKQQAFANQLIAEESKAYLNGAENDRMEMMIKIEKDMISKGEAPSPWFHEFEAYAIERLNAPDDQQIASITIDENIDNNIEKMYTEELPVSYEHIDAILKAHNDKEKKHENGGMSLQ